MTNSKIIESLCFSFESKYLNFIPSSSHNPATWIIDVFTSDEDVLLGQIKYYAQWRQYGFYPEQGTVFEKTCLKDITDFLVLLNELQRKGVKPENPQTLLTQETNGDQ